MEPIVSVIIPAYNRKDALVLCIESVLKQDYPALEIIICDDCSTDGTVRHLRKNYRMVRVLTSDRRYGPSYLRNKGIRAARGWGLLFLDSDTVLHDPGIVRRMVVIAMSDKALGQLGGEIPAYQGVKDWARGRRLTLWGNGFNVTVQRAEGTNASKKCDYLATCNCFVKKSVAQEVGGFDPYYNFGGEDADFGYSIKKRGYSNYVDYWVSAQHWHSDTGRYADEACRYHYTRVRFNIKHFSALKILFIFFGDIFYVVLYNLALPVRLFQKAIKRETADPNFLLNGLYIFKAYLANIKNFIFTLNSVGKNFLSDEEMNRYSEYVAMRFQAVESRSMASHGN
jgi:glycosyltransferase involved in cell wall biosynthesis